MSDTPEIGQRLVSDAAPDARALGDWLGPAQEAWTTLATRIEEGYPGVFDPGWVFGGKNHGWGLRYRKSRSFCTLVPEYRQLRVVIVFGAKEREKVEALLPSLPATTRGRYVEAPTFHDGKWALFAVPGDADIAAIMTLLSVKRRPKGGHTGD